MGGAQRDVALALTLALALPVPLTLTLTRWAARGVTAFTWFDTVRRVYTEAAPGCYDNLVAAVHEARAAATPTLTLTDPS